MLSCTNGSKKIYVLEFELSGLPKTTNSTFKNNWRALIGESNKWKTKVIKACYGKTPPKPLTKAKLTLIRCSSVRPDFDGLVSSFKSAIDGLKRANVLIDDNYDVIGQPYYGWELAPRGKGKIKIKVTGLEE